MFETAEDAKAYLLDPYGDFGGGSYRIVEVERYQVVSSFRLEPK